MQGVRAWVFIRKIWSPIYGRLSVQTQPSEIILRFVRHTYISVRVISDKSAYMKRSGASINVNMWGKICQNVDTTSETVSQLDKI